MSIIQSRASDTLYSRTLKMNQFKNSNFREVINPDSKKQTRIAPTSNLVMGGITKFRLRTHEKNQLQKDAYLTFALNELSATGDTPYVRLDKVGLLSLIDYIEIHSGSHKIARVERDSMITALSVHADNSDFEGFVKHQLNWVESDADRNALGASQQLMVLPLSLFFNCFATVFPSFMLKNESFEVVLKMASQDVIQTDGTLGAVSFDQAKCNLYVDNYYDEAIASFYRALYSKHPFQFPENDYIIESKPISANVNNASVTLDNITNRYLVDMVFMVRPNSSIHVAGEYDVLDFVEIEDQKLYSGSTRVDFSHEDVPQEFWNKLGLQYHNARNAPYMKDKNLYVISYAENGTDVKSNRLDRDHAYHGSVDTHKWSSVRLDLRFPSTLSGEHTLTAVYDTKVVLGLRDGYLVKL